MNEIVERIDKHKSGIMTGIGLAGCVISVGMAIHATPKAMARIEMEEETKFANTGTYELTKWEVVKVSWKYYVMTGLTLAASFAAILNGKCIDIRNGAAATTAFNILSSQAKSYQDKVIEVYGEKGHRKIMEEVEKEALVRNPVPMNGMGIVETGFGTSLAYDIGTGRYFRTSKENIDRAENEINFKLREEIYISVNDLYNSLGMEGVEFGDLLGWNVDDGPIHLGYGDSFTASNGEPCLILTYSVSPREDYQKLI